MSAHRILSDIALAQASGSRVVTEITATSATDPAEIPEDATFVIVTAASATYAIQLPLTVPGRKIEGYVGANGCEMWASENSAGTAVTINGTTASETNEAAIPATTYFIAICTSTTSWILLLFDEAGDDIAGVTPDAR